MIPSKEEFEIEYYKEITPNDFEIKDIQNDIKYNDIDFKRDLNKEQLNIINNIRGPMLVIAGAGSGKTRTIVYAVAKLLSVGVKPHEIMLVTFTNKAAHEMISRVKQLLGVKPKGIWAGTFHSLANRFIRKYTRLLGLKPNYVIMDETDSHSLMKLAIEKADVGEIGLKFPTSKMTKSILSYSINCHKSVQEVKENHSDDRSNAKAVNFGIAFGKSIYTLSEDLDISYEEADNLVNKEYFGAAPVLKSWIDDTHEFASKYGYVTNIFGRKRHLPNAQIEVPDYLPWPNKFNRPKCYRKGPYFNLLGLDQRWRETNDDWYHFVNNLGEDEIKRLTRDSGSSYFGKCLGCEHIFSCVINTEIKRVNNLYNKAMRQSVNSPIQGGASDMMSLAWTWIGPELRRQELDAYIVLNIHDELVVYAHNDCVDAASKIMDYYMTEYMKEFTRFRVPLVVDTEIVSRWSDKY